VKKLIRFKVRFARIGLTSRRTEAVLQAAANAPVKSVSRPLVEHAGRLD
jgi:hypothetical protein